MDLLDERKDLDTPSGSRPYVRPELVMGIIALFCGVLVILLLILLPALPAVSDDPEAPKYEAQVSDDPELPGLTEPTDPLEEPEDPTIPPDPNPYDSNDFQYNRQNYLLLQNLPSSPGVDVSAWQAVIDWDKVAASGIEFAFVRVGFRGYESGKINEDTYGRRNLEGAAAAGLKVGVYFFSQAVNIQEVDQEIAYIVDFLGDWKPDLPVVLDWEIPAANARTANMDRRTLTDMQKHFITVMEEKGYEPMVYFSPYQSRNLYYLSELEEAPFWLAHYQDRMTFPWKVEYWQYSDNGKVPGINGPVDMNVYMPD